MSTYYSLCYHWTCSTEVRRLFIVSGWRQRFHEYLGGTMRGLDEIALEVGGVEDHVHLLIGLKTVHCLADFSRELKKAASSWAAANGDPNFSWQEGCSVFTVSRSRLDSVRRYIQGQEERHRKASFGEELKSLLERHGIAYDERYLH